MAYVECSGHSVASPRTWRARVVPCNRVLRIATGASPPEGLECPHGESDRCGDAFAPKDDHGDQARHKLPRRFALTSFLADLFVAREPLLDVPHQRSAEMTFANVIDRCRGGAVIDVVNESAKCAVDFGIGGHRDEMHQ
ncbi:hypothetical protein [Pandoraea sputorum]|uniref:hypothetical protein n=1 Tax=Pandoraea sputorum TaxID=93222 RepID=UPI00123FC4C2|nr:hypothetical protein [Pandoraea sputorum]